MKANAQFVRLGSLKTCTKGGNGNDYDCCFRGTYYEATEDDKGEKKTYLRGPRRAKR